MTTNCFSCWRIDYYNRSGRNYYCNYYADYRPLSYNCPGFRYYRRQRYVKPVITIQYELF